MSLVAVIPVASLAAANATLQVAGFGASNFLVPAYSGAAPTHAALHSWTNAVFETAVTGIAGVVTNIGTGDPVTRTKALIEAQGAKWGAQSPALPSTGSVTAGTYYRYGLDLWYVIQTYSRTTYPQEPSTLPALICRVRPVAIVEPWAQPLYAFNAYKLINPFTGKPDKCLGVDGKVYATKLDNNTYSPEAYPAGWQVQI